MLSRAEDDSGYTIVFHRAKNGVKSVQVEACVHVLRVCCACTLVHSAVLLRRAAEQVLELADQQFPSAESVALSMARLDIAHRRAVHHGNLLKVLPPFSIPKGVQTAPTTDKCREAFLNAPSLPQALSIVS